MARPKLKIDPNQVEKMATIGVPVSDIADILGCDRKTIYNHFSTQIMKGRAEGRARLRQVAWQSALKGNVAMTIFLLKNYCDMSDNDQVIENNHKNEELLKSAGSKD
jgi:hypothetical protein